MRITDSVGIAPANYKSGMLIMNRYRLMDVFIMIAAFLWAFIWMVLLLFVFEPTIWAFVLFVFVIPILAIAMVQPMANYHNNLEYLILMFKYYRRNKYFTNSVRKIAGNKQPKKRGKLFQKKWGGSFDLLY